MVELADTAPRVLDQAVFEGYVTGLREAGWRGDHAVVRFAFTAFCALKHLCFLTWLADVEDEAKQRKWESVFKCPFADFTARQVELVNYQLQLAGEAGKLSAYVTKVTGQ